MIEHSDRDDGLAKANMIRLKTYPQPVAPNDCAFHIGEPGTDCRGCGATWDVHYRVVIDLNTERKVRRAPRRTA